MIRKLDIPDGLDCEEIDGLLAYETAIAGAPKWPLKFADFTPADQEAKVIALLQHAARHGLWLMQARRPNAGQLGRVMQVPREVLQPVLDRLERAGKIKMAKTTKCYSIV